MSARELAVAHQEPGECAWCDERYQKIEDAVAHELAEKLRDDSLSRRDRWGRYDNEAREGGQLAAADLIDPEVQS